MRQLERKRLCALLWLMLFDVSRRQNESLDDAGIGDSHDEVLAYMRFLGGGAVDEARLAAFVARSPEVLKFFTDCGIRSRLVRGVTDHY